MSNNETEEVQPSREQVEKARIMRQEKIEEEINYIVRMIDELGARINSLKVIIQDDRAARGE